MKNERTTKQKAKTNADTKTKLAAETAKLGKMENGVRNILRDAFCETERTAEDFAELSGLLEEYSTDMGWDDMLLPWDSLTEIERKAGNAIQMCHDLLEPVGKLVAQRKRVEALRKAQRKAEAGANDQTVSNG